MRHRAPLRLTSRGRLAAAVVAVAVGSGGVVAARNLVMDLPVVPDPVPAAPSASPSPAPPPPVWEEPTLAATPAATLAATLAGAQPAATVSGATIGLAGALFDQAPVMVVVPEPEPPGGSDRDRLARWLALRLRAPLVHAGPDLRAFVEEQAVRTVVAVGLSAEDDRLVRDLVPEVRSAFAAARSARLLPREGDVLPDLAGPAARAAGSDPQRLAELQGTPVDAWLADVRDLLDLARPAPTPPRNDVGLLARADDAASWALLTSAAVAGVPGAAAAGPDPRASAGVVARLGGVERITRVGTAAVWSDVDPDTLAWQLGTVERGDVLPGGGQTLFPGKLLVALYGHPDGGALGVLGEQGVQGAVTRAQATAAPYTELTGDVVVPTFEIIATVASRGPEARGDYSRRTPIATLRPWVEAARAAGIYVVLDLQPGRTSFLEQAAEYEELLREPHVGLALDPEWRLQPDQVHLRQIGSVDAAEVNATADWLAALVRRERLPQKLFVVHQFKLSMIRDRPALDLGHPELAAVIHVDGQGGQAAKDETYRALTQLDPPPHVRWGWKNF
ncbi:MAG TPA: hypothetical protein VGA69_10420, partial [Nitriliruptorales bacterium]